MSEKINQSKALHSPYENVLFILISTRQKRWAKRIIENQSVVHTKGSFIISDWALFWMRAILRTIISYDYGLILTIQGKTEAYMSMPLLFLLVLTVELRLSSQVLIQFLICLSTLHKSRRRLIKKIKVCDRGSVGFLIL